MDVVGEHIVFAAQGLDAFLQALQRQAIRRIDSRRAQDADTHSGAAPEMSQLAFGIDTAPRARRGWPQRSGFVDSRTGTIAVNAAGANVDHAQW